MHLRLEVLEYAYQVVKCSVMHHRNKNAKVAQSTVDSLYIIHSHCAEDYHNEKINDIPGVALTGETCTNDSTVEVIRRYAYYNFSGPAICYN